MELNIPSLAWNVYEEYLTLRHVGMGFKGTAEDLGERTEGNVQSTKMLLGFKLILGLGLSIKLHFYCKPRQQLTEYKQ